MGLLEIIMAEHSRSQAYMIADIILQKPELLDELIKIIFADKEPLSRRAAWPLRFIHERDKQLLIPYFPYIIKQLCRVRSVAVQRNLLYILANSDIPEASRGELLQYTSELLENKSTSVAPIIYSIDIFYKLSEGNPDLLNELSLMIELLLPHATAGVKSKSIKTLRKIDQFNKSPNN